MKMELFAIVKVKPLPIPLLKERILKVLPFREGFGVGFSSTTPCQRLPFSYKTKNRTFVRKKNILKGLKNVGNQTLNFKLISPLRSKQRLRLCPLRKIIGTAMPVRGVERKTMANSFDDWLLKNYTNFVKQNDDFSARNIKSEIIGSAKEKVILEMISKRLSIFVMMIVVCGGAWAQVESVTKVGDTLHIGNISTVKPYETVGDAVSPYGLEQTDFGSFENKEMMPLDSVRPMAMTYRFEGQKPMTALGRWNGGWVTGANNIYFTPLVGYTATANVLAVENIGRWEFMGNAGLQKYGGMANTFTFDASAMYRINNNVSATVFGNYQSPSFWSTYKTPSGYQYGGYLSFETNNHKWGIDVGARHVFNPWNGQHAVIPIVMPYYKIGKNKLGIDLGGLFNRNGANDGPPMFVPKPRPMPPAPRR